MTQHLVTLSQEQNQQIIYPFNGKLSKDQTVIKKHPNHR